MLNGDALNRVVVTGLGLVTPLACGVKASWDRLIAGESGIAGIQAFDVSDLPAKIGAMVPRGETSSGRFNPDDWVPTKDQRKMDDFIVYAISAAIQAVEDSGWKPTDDESRERTGVMIGSGIGGLSTIYDTSIVLAERGPRRVSPFFIPASLINLASGHVSIRYGFKGPNHAVVTACATGAHANGDAARMIEQDDADVMVAGGAEAAVFEAMVGGFDSMKALSRRNDDPSGSSRPFDTGRDGFVIGEGAGVVVLESLEHAQARGVEILAELVGYGATADASHITLPAPGGIGAVRAARRALEKAGLAPAEVDHINAHATSTPEGDKAELQAVRTILGDDAGRVAITANKSMLGHTLGAAGAIEAIVTILSIREGCIPPTINLADPDPVGEGLDLTPNVATRRDVRVALSNSFGFGGQNTALVFRRWDA